MLANKMHFLSLEACILLLSSISSSPDFSFLMFFGSPITDSIALCINKGNVSEKSFLFLLIMKNCIPPSLEKVSFYLDWKENSVCEINAN